jgi:hypothetical protein
VDLLRFLVNDCDGTAYDCKSGAATVGPGWTIVEVYDGNREVPPTATDVDSLATAVAWKGDGSGLAVGDWFVVESADSTNENGSNHMQMVVEYDSSTDWKFRMCPLADWTTGAAGCGGGGCTPDNPPATCVGLAANPVTFTTDAGATSMSIVATEAGMFLWRDAAAVDYIYVGELIGTSLTGAPADDRAFVITNTTQLMYPTYGAAVIQRLSPVDDSTRLVTGWFQYPSNGASPWTTAGAGALLGVYAITPLGVYFADAGALHFAGYLPFVFIGQEDMGVQGTLDSAAYVHRSSSATEANFVLPWDGSAYP